MKQPVPFFYKPRYRKHQSAILVPKKEWHPLFHDGKFRDALRWMLTYIIHSGFISGYQNRYGDNLKPPTNVYHRMTA